MTKIKFREIVLGTHYFRDCPYQSVSFLKNEHHHDFIITVQCDVEKKNRELEWIMLRIFLKKIIKNNFEILNEIVRFKNRSCEMIADEIKKEFKKKYPKYNWKVSVSEDGVYEGGEW
jgi:6-pyruvoyl-tetrahydropterin synthase